MERFANLAFHGFGVFRDSAWVSGRVASKPSMSEGSYTKNVPHSNDGKTPPLRRNEAPPIPMGLNKVCDNVSSLVRYPVGRIFRADRKVMRRKSEREPCCARILGWRWGGSIGDKVER